MVIVLLRRNLDDTLKDITVKSAAQQTVTAVVYSIANLGIYIIVKVKVSLIQGVKNPCYWFAIGLAFCGVLSGRIKGMLIALLQKVINNNDLLSADSLLEKMSAMKSQSSFA